MTFLATCCVCLVFFFKQKTAYELRISDWSSDVCSSDLLPATVALIVIAGPVIAGLFQHGRFGADDAAATAAALTAFAWGLPAYVLVKILQPAFYAREDTVTPFRYSVVSVVANIALSLVQIGRAHV